MAGAFLLALLLQADVQANETYRLPPEIRGDLSAVLEIQLADPAAEDGDWVSLIVTLKGGESLEVEPLRIDDPTNAWKITRASSWGLDNGRVVSCATIYLRQVKPGFPALPSVTARFRSGPDMQWEEVAWPSPLKEARPGPDPIAVPPVQYSRSRWPLMVGILLLLGGSAGMWRALTRKTVPQSSPEELALNQIEVLANGDWHDSKGLTQLADIVRGYVAARFQVPVLCMTTPEFLKGPATSIPEEVRIPLADFLQRCDLAKFAPLPWSPTEKQELLDLARSIIRTVQELNKASPVA